MDELPVSTDPNLVKFDNNNKTREFRRCIHLMTPENTIADQNRLSDNDTENKIKECYFYYLHLKICRLQKPRKHAKVTAQVYFTPTVSYRKLIRK